MKQKLYALDAFFIEKLKLSENDPHENKSGKYIYMMINIIKQQYFNQW